MSASAGLERGCGPCPGHPQRLRGAAPGRRERRRSRLRPRHDQPARQAREIAGRTGDGNQMGTAFGHVNVAIHAIATRCSSATPGRRSRPGRHSTGHTAAGLTGRRTQLRLDLARAYAMRKQDAAAVNLAGRRAAQPAARPLRRPHPRGPHHPAAPRAPALHPRAAPTRPPRRSDLTRTSLGPPPRTKVRFCCLTGAARASSRRLPSCLGGNGNPGGARWPDYGCTSSSGQAAAAWLRTPVTRGAVLMAGQGGERIRSRVAHGS